MPVGVNASSGKCQSNSTQVLFIAINSILRHIRRCKYHFTAKIKRFMTSTIGRRLRRRNLESRRRRRGGVP